MNSTTDNTTQPLESGEMKAYTLHRRFDRFARLVGDPTMLKLRDLHVLIVGVGGVGSWAAESLARSGVGQITLVDFDEICITNTNRQLHTVSGLIGEKKAKVMAERLRKINPQGKFEHLDMFYNADNSDTVLSSKPDIVIDAIDNITAKCHLIATCRNRGIRVLVAGGAGAKVNPLAIKMADLADTHTDPFLAQIRKVLRQKYDFPETGKFGIPTVFSDEAITEPEELTYDKGMGFKCVCPQGQNSPHGCEKRNVIHGTASFVTGAMGLALAAQVIAEVRAPK